MNRPVSRLATLLVTVALVIAHARAAWALAPLSWSPEPDDDLPLALDLGEGASHALWREDASAHAPLWLSLGAIAHLPDQGPRELGVLLLVGVPLDRLARRSARPADLAPRGRARRLDETPAFADDAAPLKPTRRPRATPEPLPQPAPPPLAAPTEPPRTAEAPPTIPIVVGADVARAAVRAALRRARLLTPDAALDALGTRARASSLLPELRLRALRRADDGQALAPTEYDPTRTTSTTGQSVWLEARATWRLDRLVFADDEVAIERLRDQRAEAQAKLVAHVLDLLFAWQRATTAAADPKRTPEERLEATLRRIEAEAALDVATDAWFTRWLASRP